MSLSSPAVQDNQSSEQNYILPLVILTSLFFIWGFITSLNDILIPHLKAVFDLSYFQAMAVNFAFFGAYAIVSLPAGNLVKKLGYQRGIVTGLLIAAVGCFAFTLAAEAKLYWVFLLALFILASGITVLQVSANPYVSRLGPVNTASSRLNMTQAFNSLGTTLAPLFGAFLILSVATLTASELSALSVAEQAEYHSQQAQAVQFPYLLLCLALLVLAGVFTMITLPEIASDQQTQTQDTQASIWQQKHLLLGAGAIFLYVGAEVAIGSFLVNFLAEPHIAGLTEFEAAKYVSYYWGGAMIGRFIGAALMVKIAAEKVLMFNSLAAAIAVAMVIVTQGTLAMWLILAVGLFNSIMFPTIFSLAIRKLGMLTSQGSGLLCMAIVGGALIPMLQGAIADVSGIQLAFVVPAVCYVYIAFFGWKSLKAD